MNIRRLSRTIIYSTAALLSLLLAPSCTEANSGDDPDDPVFKEGVDTEVRVSLTSRSGNYTRGDGEPRDPNSSIELIHDWWIAFVDLNGKVTIKQGGGTASDPGFETETFTFILPSGTYDVYAFANITTPADPETFIKGLLDNNKKITGKALSELVKNSEFQNGMQWSSEKNIPMTGQMQVKIRNTIEEAFSIEVIRAVAKVEFTIENPTDDYIKLKNLTFDRITTSDISLFPDYTAIGQKAYSPFVPLDKDGNKISASYGTLTLDNYLNPDVLEKTNPCKFFFYCKESLGQKYAGVDDESFKITLTVDRQRANEPEMEVNVPREFYTRSTGNIKNYINRNDWIDIHISFNDWKIFWKLHFYPPIGGYPPVFNQDPEGATLTATVTTGGEFELYPYKIEKNGTEYNEKISWNKTDVNVLNGADMYAIQPAKVPNPGNLSPHPVSSDYIIAGELNPKVGISKTSQVKISFELDDNDYTGTLFNTVFTIKRE